MHTWLLRIFKFSFILVICFMVGLVLDVKNFFVHFGILFMFNLVMNQILAMFAAASITKSSAQAMGAVILLFAALFCGFIGAPNITAPWAHVDTLVKSISLGTPCIVS